MNKIEKEPKYSIKELTKIIEAIAELDTDAVMRIEWDYIQDKLSHYSLEELNRILKGERLEEIVGEIKND